MTEPIRGLPRTTGIRRNPINGLILGAVVLAIGGPVRGGVIRRPTVHARRVVEIEKADPNSGYWERALQLHTLKLAGPRVHNLYVLNADGSVAATAFIRYMQWREGLNVKRFDSLHPLLAQQLRKVKFPKPHPTPSPTSPGTYVPPTGSTPIQPPNFTPIEQGLNPPHVPEPSSAVIAVCMIGVAALARRWSRRT